jgi:hypothetical protein
MKTVSTLHRPLSLAWILAATLACAAPSQAQVPKPNIVPPGATPFGATYGEWSARWWQWALGIPADRSPFFDASACTHGAQDQDGPVWFLAGVVNETGIADRECSIPAGKAVLVPVVNVECSTLEGNGTNEAELRACLATYRFGNVHATIDGVAVPDIERYFVESPSFELTLPANNVIGLPAGTGASVGKGYYLMLPPLSAGKRHVVEFMGSFPDFAFTVSLTYRITVVPETPRTRP